MGQLSSGNRRSFRKRLLKWFADHKRDFPWRHYSDPYLVLIAEMMLRRTRAKQVVPVYESFVREYPNPEEMYGADSRDLKATLRPLGLEWRIAQFEELGRDLVEEFDGAVPSTRKELTRLTGVSDYVADAVLVFALGQPRAVVDANVARVITRYFGLREHAESRRDKAVRGLADELLDRKHPREYNFAMLDLAALVCSPANPKHDECPLRRTCVRVKRQAA